MRNDLEQIVDLLEDAQDLMWQIVEIASGASDRNDFAYVVTDSMEIHKAITGFSRHLSGLVKLEDEVVQRASQMLGAQQGDTRDEQGTEIEFLDGDQDDSDIEEQEDQDD